MEQFNIDEAFLEVADFVQELTEIEGLAGSQEMGVKMEIEQAIMEFPIELDVQVNAQGKVLIGAVPPIYYLETSIMPVFHQIKVHLEPNKH